MTRERYLIGYARVSKSEDRSNIAQRRALDAAGCNRVFEGNRQRRALGPAQAPRDDRPVA